MWLDGMQAFNQGAARLGRWAEDYGCRQSEALALAF